MVIYGDFECLTHSDRPMGSKLEILKEDRLPIPFRVFLFFEILKTGLFALCFRRRVTAAVLGGKCLAEAAYVGCCCSRMGQYYFCVLWMSKDVLLSGHRNPNYKSRDLEPRRFAVRFGGDLWDGKGERATSRRSPIR